MSVKDWQDPTLAQAKWLYWCCLVAGGVVGVVVAVRYGAPLVLVFLVAALNGMAGVTKGYYDDL